MVSVVKSKLKGHIMQPATFAVEHHYGVDWLVVIDASGSAMLIAEFVGRAAINTFNETLALAKMAAHAHGMSGI
jgi:hypothetical protein